MLELRLVGVHDDGENLVLESADGTRFALPIDMNLRTSITKARRIQPARGLGTKGSFGPRDIQTRFRQGASVEEIEGWAPQLSFRFGADSRDSCLAYRGCDGRARLLGGRAGLVYPAEG